jgi:hypothetical protein
VYDALESCMLSRLRFMKLQVAFDYERRLSLLNLWPRKRLILGITWTENFHFSRARYGPERLEMQNCDGPTS